MEDMLNNVVPTGPSEDEIGMKSPLLNLAEAALK